MEHIIRCPALFLNHAMTEAFFCRTTQTTGLGDSQARAAIARTAGLGCRFFVKMPLLDHPSDTTELPRRSSFVPHAKTVRLGPQRRARSDEP